MRIGVESMMDNLNAEIAQLRAELDRCIAQIADLTKIRLEDELVHGNIMGRIAVALFGEQNNRGDEDCVAQAIEVVQERNSLRQHLHDEHQRHVGTMDERDAALADLAAARELERMWYDRYYALWVHVMPLLKLGAMHPYQKWAEEVNDQYRIDAPLAGEKK